MPNEALAPLASPPASGFSRLAIAGGLIALLLSAAAVFWPGIDGPFVFDDFPNLQNLQELDGRLDAEHLRRYVAAFSGNPGRPLSGLSFVIEDYAWPSDPLPFKRNNILLHLLTGLLVFELVRRLGRLHPRVADRADLLALATAAAWVLHPLHLSTMMLVVQRMTILSSIFMLGGLLGYLASLRCKGFPALTRVVLAGASLAGFGLLAVLSKENGVLVFAYATALNLTLLRPQIAELPPLARRILVWGAAAPMLILALLATINIQTIAAGFGVRDFTLGERLLTESRIVVEYLRQILLPRIGGQGLFHDDYPISHGLFDPFTTILAILLLTALAVSAWRFRTKAPIFAFAVFWFMSGHLIESTIVPLELYFEHRNYLAMLGPLLAVTVGVMTAPLAYRRLAWTALLLWLGMAAALSAYNATIWGHRGKLAEVWLQENPGSVRSIQFMASYQFDQGQSDAAKQTLKKGLELRPEAGELAFQMALADCFTSGLARDRLASMQSQAGSVHFARVIPDLVANLRKQAMGDQCRGTFTPQDFVRLVNTLLHNPAYARDSAQGFLHYELGKLAAHEMDLDRLMYHFDKSHAHRPNPYVLREQAIHLLTAGLPDDALRYLDMSDSTPQPVLKRWLVDMPAFNAPLRDTALEMKMQLDLREARTPKPSPTESTKLTAEVPALAARAAPDERDTVAR